MAIVEELLREEENGTVSFGNHILSDKKKVEDFEIAGDLYKVKTYNEITKLEKNGMFLYESVPGSSVTFFEEKDTGVSFVVEGEQDVQLTVGLKENTEYEVFVQNSNAGIMNTGLSGKLSLSVELAAAGEVSVRIVEV